MEKNDTTRSVLNKQLRNHFIGINKWISPTTKQIAGYESIIFTSLIGNKPKDYFEIKVFLYKNGAVVVWCGWFIGGFNNSVESKANGHYRIDSDIDARAPHGLDVLLNRVMSDFVKKVQAKSMKQFKPLGVDAIIQSWKTPSWRDAADRPDADQNRLSPEEFMDLARSTQERLFNRSVVPVIDEPYDSSFKFGLRDESMVCNMCLVHPGTIDVFDERAGGTEASVRVSIAATTHSSARINNVQMNRKAVGDALEKALRDCCREEAESPGFIRSRGLVHAIEEAIK